MPELTIISDPQISQLSIKVCAVFKAALNQLAEQNKFVVGAWPGGRSLLKFFPGICKVFCELEKEVLNSQQFFQVDERVYTEFNREILEQNFFSEMREKKIISESQIHYFPTNEGPVEGVRSYTKLLESFGLRFNYAMLGAGGPHVLNADGTILKSDCHVAGVFANHPSSEPHQAPFYYYYDSPKPPPGRVTATNSLLARSEWSFLFIMGEEKREVLKEFLDENIDLARSPIKIALEAKNCILVTDLKV